MHVSRLLLLSALLASLLVWAAGPAAAEEPITFLVTSDSHYEAIEKVERNDRNRLTIARMNELPGEPWPDKLGGGAIGRPLGVLALGDLIDDGDKSGQTDVEWGHFTQHFGLNGTDGLLRYPVFEGWGNHDGPPEKFIKQRVSVQAEIKRRNAARLADKRIARVAPNGLHYSWDWGGVHFVQTNLYPADKQNPKVRYSLPWHDPQDALAFVREDLAASVGDSGRPVIIMAHCGFDTDWWVADDWQAFYDAVRPYHVIAYFHGHTGTGVRKWMPAGADRPLDVINTGQTEKGFFVVEISSTRMRLGYHVKQDPTLLKDLAWEWKYLFQKELAPVQPARDAAREPAQPLPIAAREAAPQAAAPQASPPPVRRVAPLPDEVRTALRLSDFYRQHVDAGGLAVVGSERVTEAALLEAAYLVDRLLTGREDLRRAIAAAGVRVSVMASTELTTDVPEHSDLQPRNYWNRRARGLGATTARPSVSCGEENLLLLPGDPYQGENILIHEFAHTIHTIGLAKVAPTFDDRLRQAHALALERGRWKNAYAATNRHEYWAEGVQSWFDCNRAADKAHNGVRTREALREHDPELAALLSEVFGSHAWRYQSPRRRADPHLAAVAWEDLPRFAWPADLPPLPQK